MDPMRGDSGLQKGHPNGVGNGNDGTQSAPGTRVLERECHPASRDLTRRSGPGSQPQGVSIVGMHHSRTRASYEGAEGPPRSGIQPSRPRRLGGIDPESQGAAGELRTPRRDQGLAHTAFMKRLQQQPDLTLASTPLPAGGDVEHTAVSGSAARFFHGEVVRVNGRRPDS